MTVFIITYYNRLINWCSGHQAGPRVPQPARPQGKNTNK